MKNNISPPLEILLISFDIVILANRDLLCILA
jgi:hypothetical protein